MKWRVVLPGQPPTVNKMYANRKAVDRRGRVYQARVKVPEAAAYQEMATLIIRTAMPSGWKPTGFVWINLELFLQKDIDADNTLKAILDSVERATGVNDRWFLPCVKMKTWGVPPRSARVELLISDDPL